MKKAYSIHPFLHKGLDFWIHMAYHHRRNDPYIINESEGFCLEKYVCSVCGYVYDPEVGDPDNDIPAGTAFEDLPEDWVCPLCGAGKELFEQE